MGVVLPQGIYQALSMSFEPNKKNSIFPCILKKINASFYTIVCIFTNDSKIGKKKKNNAANKFHSLPRFNNGTFDFKADENGR